MRHATSRLGAFALSALAFSAVALALVGAAILSPAPALAQSPCGPAYTVTLGDTLHEIAQNCDTSLSALVRANDRIDDPDRIEVGWELRIPDRSETPDRAERSPRPDGGDEGAYRIQPGDTLYDIAQRLGTTLAAILAENENIDPRRLVIGQPIRLPGDAPPSDDEEEVEASVSPDAAARGERVTVEGRNFRAGEEVRVAAGLPDTEYQTIDTTRADGEGSVRARVRVPDWAEPGRNLVWVLVTNDRREAFARGFQVLARDEDADEEVDVTGVLTREGIECPALRSDRGELYTLAGETGRFGPGDRVRVRGPIPDFSICQQGTTVEVRSIEVAE